MSLVFFRPLRQHRVEVEDYSTWPRWTAIAGWGGGGGKGVKGVVGGVHTSTRFFFFFQCLYLGNPLNFGWTELCRSWM